MKTILELIITIKKVHRHYIGGKKSPRMLYLGRKNGNVKICYFDPWLMQPELLFQVSLAVQTQIRVTNRFCTFLYSYRELVMWGW